MHTFSRCKSPLKYTNTYVDVCGLINYLIAYSQSWEFPLISATGNRVQMQGENTDYMPTQLRRNKLLSPFLYLRKY